MKKCTVLKCEQQNPQPLQNFHKNSRRKDGLSNKCKSCQKLYDHIKHKKLSDEVRGRTNWQINNPERARGHVLKKFWPGSSWEIAVNNYNELFIKQNGLCKICNKEETAKQKGKPIRLAVDHCHKTGKVRGLLCDKCNKSLGLLKENFDTILNMAKYVQEHNNVI